MEKEVIQVNFNWSYCTDPDYGCDNEVYQTGKLGVTKIDYHSPLGSGDAHYCDVYKDNGEIERVFNLNRVVFKDENHNKQD